MALDVRLPLGAATVDTSQAIPQKQATEANQIEILKGKYQAASDADKLDVLSSGLGAAQALQLSETDPAAAIKFLENRNTKILARKGDNENTQLLLDTIKSDPEQFKQIAGAYVKTAQLAGAFDNGKGVDAQGGATGALLDRLVQEGKTGNPNYGLLDALEDLKGGAGARGRLGADISLGREAEYEKQSGQNTSDLEYKPKIASDTKFSEKQGEATFDLPRIRATGAEALTAIDNALASPGLKNITGWASLVPITPGGERARAEALLDQVQGRQFLAAYEMLKGGGQITEIEGKKGEDAIAALGRAQKGDDVVKALGDLRGVIIRSIQAKEAQATQTPEQVRSNTFSSQGPQGQGSNPAVNTPYDQIQPQIPSGWSVEEVQ